jgi:hypothetical protein
MPAVAASLPPLPAFADYWLGYYRWSEYQGSPWASEGGYTVKKAPTMGGIPAVNESYSHL